MYENNEQGQSEREQHLTRINTLEADLDTAKADRNLYREKLQVAQATIDRAAIWVEDAIAGSMDPAQFIEEFSGLMEILEVEPTRDVQIEVTATWRGTITLPYGVDASDLDEDDFDIDFNGHSEYETEFPEGRYDSEVHER